MGLAVAALRPVPGSPSEPYDAFPVSRNGPLSRSADIWPDFHDAWPRQISAVLNRTLPRPYYARLVMRPEIGIVGEDPPGRIVPDVALVRSRRRRGGRGGRPGGGGPGPHRPVALGPDARIRRAAAAPLRGNSGRCPGPRW